MWLSSLSDEQRNSLIRIAHDLVVSDGLLDPNEEFMLDEFRREMALTASTRDDYVDLKGLETVFESKHSRIVALLNLLRLSYVDGEFDVEEECLLKELANNFGVEDESFRVLDNWVRRFMSLEREARELMR